MGRLGRLLSAAVAVAVGSAVGGALEEAGWLQLPPLPPWLVELAPPLTLPPWAAASLEAAWLRLPPLPPWLTEQIAALPPLPDWVKTAAEPGTWRGTLQAAAAAAAGAVNAAEPHLEALSRGREGCLEALAAALRDGFRAVEPHAEALVADLRPRLPPAAARLPASALLLPPAALAAALCILAAVRLLRALLACLALGARRGPPREAPAAAEEAAPPSAADGSAVADEVIARGRSASRALGRSRADSPAPRAAATTAAGASEEDALPAEQHRQPLGELTQNVLVEGMPSKEASSCAGSVEGALLAALNEKPLEELVKLQGLGEKSARRILAYRKQGVIERMEDLVTKVGLPRVVLFSLARKQGLAM